MRDNDFLVSINHNSEAIMKKIVNIRYVLYERPQSDGRCWSDVSKLFAMILLRFGNSLELFIQNLKRIEDELAVPFLLQYSNNFSIVKYCEKLQIFSNFLHSSGRYFDVTYGKIEGIYPDEGKLTFLMNKIKELYTQLNELSVLIKNNLPPHRKRPYFSKSSGTN